MFEKFVKGWRCGQKTEPKSIYSTFIFKQKMDYLRNTKPKCVNHDATIKESELSEKA